MSRCVPSRSAASIRWAVRGEGAYVRPRWEALSRCVGRALRFPASGTPIPPSSQRSRPQLAELPFAHTSFFSNQPMEALADALLRHAPPGFERVYFVSADRKRSKPRSSSPANTSWRKASRGRRFLIARKQSYQATRSAPWPSAAPVAAQAVRDSPRRGRTRIALLRVIAEGGGESGRSLRRSVSPPRSRRKSSAGRRRGDGIRRRNRGRSDAGRG